VGLIVTFGCGSSAPPAAKVASPSAQKAAAPPTPTAATAAPLTVLHRADVVSVVNAGFGTFLERVQVEPSLDAGRFRGWTIVDLSPPTFWQAVDLKPGDVVTRVNGMPIERETEAWAAFEALKTASSLDISYYRAGAERTLAYRIVD
jgi:type II secretory pathway component PulC